MNGEADSAGAVQRSAGRYARDARRRDPNQASQSHRDPSQRTHRPEAPPSKGIRALTPRHRQWAAGHWLCFLEERQAISWIRDRLFAGTRVRLSSRAMLGARAGAVSGDQRIRSFDRVGSIGRCGVDRLSEREKEEIVRLSAMGLPSRLIGQRDRSAPSDGVGLSREVASPGGARAGSFARCGCRCMSGRRSRGVSLRVSLGVRSHGGWVGRRRRSCGRSPVTVMCDGIGPARLIELHWVKVVARRCRSWRRVRGCERRWNRSSSCGGRRNRSRVGWWKSFPAIWRCACLTRRSICRCSCSHAARYARN